MRKKISLPIMVVAIIFIGFLLRYTNYAVWPRDGATFDEYAWPFLGISIIKTGIPTSWSPHSAYINTSIYITTRGARFRLVTPYLEHPPLFGIITGIFARAVNITNFDQVHIKSLRIFPLILGILSMYLVFLLSNILYGTTIAVIASFLYSIIPSVAVGSRLIQNENFFIPLFLLVLLYIQKYLKQKRKIYLSIATCICFVLPLAKVPWISAGIAGVFIYIFNRKYREALHVGIASMISIATYILYGFLYNKEVFLSLMKLQLTRYDMTYNSVYALFTTPYLTDRLFLDGWIYIGWFVIFFLAVTNFKRHTILLIGLFSYFMVYLIAIPNEPSHGWYRYPFYPFLIIALSVFLKDNFNKNSIVTCIFLLLTGLSMLQHTWAPAFGFSYMIYRGYILLCSFGLIPLFFPHKKIIKIAAGLNSIILLCVVILTMWSTVGYNEQ